MTLLVIVVLILAFHPGAGWALPAAQSDADDRFPFVVSIKYQQRLICSGTVLFPRVVVTAAHCLQQKMSWRGQQIYVDDYISPTDLSIGVTQKGSTTNFAVTGISISPTWQSADLLPVEKLSHDVAVIVTQEPIDVAVPARLQEPSVTDSHDRLLPNSDAAMGEAAGAPPTRDGTTLGQGILVTYGARHCFSPGQCQEVGQRGFLAVAISDNSECFRDDGSRRRAAPHTWCLRADVLPGDSGGPLLLETGDGKFYDVGVISASQALSPELGAFASRKFSVASDLLPSLDFILGTARSLGYGN